MDTHYYHLRCGGQLVYLTQVDDAPVHRCDKCAERGHLFVDEMIDDENRNEDSEFFNMLPTTFTFNDVAITVCGLITDHVECNRIVNEFLRTGRWPRRADSPPGLTSE